MAALCASRWSAHRLYRSPNQKPFYEGTAECSLCLPLVGSRLYESHDQKRLDTGRPSHGSGP